MNEVETRSVSIPIAVIVPLIATILSGCFIGDPDISGLDVHNDTDHTIWVDEFPQTEETLASRSPWAIRQLCLPGSARNDASKRRPDLVV